MDKMIRDDKMITEFDCYLFSEGTHYEIFDKMGAHTMVCGGIEGTYFAVWAPGVKNVRVVGDFNGWNGSSNVMIPNGLGGIYDLFIPHVSKGELYKFLIETDSGEFIYKADPYANRQEIRPGTASVVENIDEFEWKDGSWMEQKFHMKREDMRRKPMAIYELQIGSWKKHMNGTDDGFYNYREIAHDLAEYMLDMGYTHVELMGIAEYPYDGSWGYQVTGYYAPTSRYGTPEDFMYFVDYMHGKGIGVILDWVPAHFPKDSHGLARFTGKPLYEHADKRRGEHPHWGTLIFDYGRNEVSNFLLANALFWLKKYHIDGLRVDAVASMLYLDYGKEKGEWLPNKYGGRENLEAISFFKHLNQVVDERSPGSYLIAEESTAWPRVSAPVDKEGLGFHFKWNMGWMNDFLEYMKIEPLGRKYNHSKLTFSLMYVYSENFIQVLSHDEVVHGKGSMIEKMPGNEEEKFANLRLAYGFMYGHPGKKLLFMGQDFAQKREWSEKRELDWFLLGEKKNLAMKNYVKKLNSLYNRYSAFYYNDYDFMGFEWINCTDEDRSIIAFVRRGDTSKDQLLFVCNFTLVERKNYKVGVPCSGRYTEILNSDSTEFGGHSYSRRVLKAENKECDGKNYSIEFKLPPLSIIIFKYNYVDN